MPTPEILIAEDNIIIGLDLELVLCREGYVLRDVLGSGEEVLAQCEEKIPELVILNVRLNGEMDGIETANRLRTRFAIPILFLTGDDPRYSGPELASIPISRVLLKPYVHRQLRIAIEELLVEGAALPT